MRTIGEKNWLLMDNLIKPSAVSNVRNPLAARMIDVINYFDCRQSVKNLLNYEERHIIKRCYYCKKCKKCERFYAIKTEFEKRGFWTFNKNIRHWDVRDPKYNERNRKFEIIPIRDPLFRI